MKEKIKKMTFLVSFLMWGTVAGAETYSVSFNNAPGMVSAFALESCPQGWIKADGTQVSRTGTYGALFLAMGTIHGAGNGTTTFNLPDYRGVFLRGVDSGAARDPDRASRTALNSGGSTGDRVGSYQVDEFKSHKHLTQMSGSGSNATLWHPNPNLSSANRAYATAILNDTNYGNYGDHMSNSGGQETRPKNVNVLYCIKY